MESKCPLLVSFGRSISRKLVEYFLGCIFSSYWVVCTSRCRISEQGQGLDFECHQGIDRSDFAAESLRKGHFKNWPSNRPSLMFSLLNRLDTDISILPGRTVKLAAIHDSL